MRILCIPSEQISLFWWNRINWYPRVLLWKHTPLSIENIMSLWQLVAPTEAKYVASTHPRAQAEPGFFWIRHGFFWISLRIQKNPPSFALPGSKILRPPPPKSPADPTKNEVLVWNRLIHCPKGILSDKCLELACGSLLSLTWTRLLETKPSINMYKQLSARGFGFWCNNTFWYLKV